MSIEKSKEDGVGVGRIPSEWLGCVSGLDPGLTPPPKKVLPDMKEALVPEI